MKKRLLLEVPGKFIAIARYTLLFMLIAGSSKLLRAQTEATVTSVSGTSPLCIGTTAIYIAGGVILGGGLGEWSSSNTSVATVNPNTGEVTAVSGGSCDIIFTITGGFGGITFAQQSLTVNFNVGITAATALSDQICAYATTTLTANGVIGTNATVTWYSLPGGAGTNFGTGQTLENAVPGTYYARVTGDCGTPDEASVTITSKPQPTLSGISAEPSVVCIGEGAATLTYSGLLDGENMLNYDFTDPGIPSTTVIEETVTATGGTYSTPYNLSTAGEYIVKINSITVDGCTANFTENNEESWIVNPLPNLTIAGTASVCLNDDPPSIVFANLQALAVTLTYNINEEDEQTIALDANASAVVSVPTFIEGTYNYNLVSAAYQSEPTCAITLSGAATVTVKPTPQSTGFFTAATEVCVGSPVTVTAMDLMNRLTQFHYVVGIEVIGQSYTITDFYVTKDVTNGEATFTIDVPVSGGYYIILNSITIDGCEKSGFKNYAFFFAEPLPSVDILGETSVCIGDGTELEALTSGGVGMNMVKFQYLEAGGWVDLFESEDTFELYVTPIVTTTYRAIYSRTGYGCTTAISDEHTITVIDVPTASINGITPACETTGLTAISDATSPVYIWYNNDVPIDGETNATLDVTVSGSYTVKVTNGATSCAKTCEAYAVTINPQPDEPAANSYTGEYDCEVHTATATTPEGISVNYYDTQTGGNEVSAPISSNAGTNITVYAESVDLTTGCKSAARTPVTLEITKTTPAVYVTIADWEYNCDTKDAIATVAGACNDNITDPAVSYLYEGTGLTVYSSANSPENVGTYIVNASFTGNANYSAASEDEDFTITPIFVCENNYNGDVFVNTSNPNGGSAVILLSIKIPEARTCDLINAGFIFTLDPDPSVGITKTAGSLSRTLNSGIWTFSQPWTINLGTNLSTSITVDWIFSGNYSNAGCANQSTIVTVSAPASDFTSGGGDIILTDSYGTKAGSDGTINNFGFSVKWGKNYSNLKGSFDTKWRQDGGISFQAKSNKPSYMKVTEVPNSNPKKYWADVTYTNVNMKQLCNGCWKDGNGSILLRIYDMGDPGIGVDSIGFAIKDKNGILIYSSNIYYPSNSFTKGQILDRGDIQIKPAKLNGIEVNETIVIEQEDPQFTLLVYPNPTSGPISFKFTLPETAKVTLEIFTASGVLVDQVLEEEVIEGIEKTAILNKPLPQGMYYYRLTYGAYVCTGKFIIIL